MENQDIELLVLSVLELDMLDKLLIQGTPKKDSVQNKAHPQFVAVAVVLRFVQTKKQPVGGTSVTLVLYTCNMCFRTNIVTTKYKYRKL